MNLVSLNDEVWPDWIAISKLTLLVYTVISNRRDTNIYEYYIFFEILTAVTGTALGDFGIRLF